MESPSRPSQTPGAGNLAPGRCSELEVLTTADHPPFLSSAQRFPGGLWTRSRQEPSAVETEPHSEPKTRLRYLSRDGIFSSVDTAAHHRGTSEIGQQPLTQNSKKVLKMESLFISSVLKLSWWKNLTEMI